MQNSSLVALLLAFWSSLYLLDVFLKSYRRYGKYYQEFQEQHGITVSIGQARWYTTCMNRVFLKIGQSNSTLFHAWFTFGIWFGIIAMVSSIVLLVFMLIKTFQQDSTSEQVLTPVMPGVNLPLSQIAYYFLTLAVCGILHEFGHAIAAVKEQVRVNGFGVFIFLLYPGAYVDLYTEHLNAISPLRQLRIYCAGVWHNFIIVVVCILLLHFLPVLLLPLYTMGNGAIVTEVLPHSPVSGENGLDVGYKLLSINGCTINTSEDLLLCVNDVIHQPTKGYCLSIDDIQQMNKANTDTSKDASERKYACLTARSVTDRITCSTYYDCIVHRDMACLHPALDKNTYLLRIIHDSGPAVLFVGDPYFLTYTVRVSSYIPRYTFSPISFPNMLDTLLKYFISLSGALAILNSVPCYALDGQWILTAYVEYIFAKSIPKPTDRSFLINCILLCGTLLLVSNILIAMVTLFMS
ncbi:membrane-bound transcription factor site-2 protease-like [Saccoglossus kowalevskii]|uniref:Membrane-bound transcription factor site-2 protease n=1 Tax=Saccoglossus kowalevskii TaxID=10224 RepID=A0ABM0M533_SACKO|nr:PREDICTED: membrane-bound transcription factor site-2 protease-like [Saccoglossus kowalevskii]